VRIWTAHLKSDAAPILVREGFSLGAFVFGPLWLAAHRAWIPAAFVLAAWLAIGTLTAGDLRDALSLGLLLLQGVSGHDLRRWSLERRGFTLAQVVTGRRADNALEALLRRRPDQGDRLARADGLR
jgi:hypothetical protein